MPPTIGRPRNNKTTEKILDTALTIALNEGVEYATVEYISKVSGVAKSTIYRRWRNSATIILEALIDKTRLDIGYDPKIHIQADLKRVSIKIVEIFGSSLGSVLQKLLGKAQSDDGLREAFLESWILPRREEGKHAIRAAIGRGELKESADPDHIIMLIYGSIYYNFFVLFESMDEKMIERVVDSSLDGLVVS